MVRMQACNYTVKLWKQLGICSRTVKTADTSDDKTFHMNADFSQIHHLVQYLAGTAILPLLFRQTAILHRPLRLVCTTTA
jgi:hypothetical protein